MISIEDINLWREDEKKTQFLKEEEERKVYAVVADFAFNKNQQFGGTYVGKAAALKGLAGWKHFWPKFDFRIEEVKE